MAITDTNGLVAGMDGSQRLSFYKASQTAEGAGTFHSLWKAASLPGAGSTPSTTASVPTSATAGAFLFTNPVSGKTYLGGLRVAGSTIGTVILYDRLMHVSGLSGTQTTVDTAVSNTPLTRYTNGIGVEAWFEFYSAIGATGATLNFKYTNSDDATNQSGAYTHPANAESVGQMVPGVLAAGAKGVKAVTAYHWSVSTGTAGDFGVTLIKRLAEVPLTVVNVSQTFNAIDLGMPVIEDNACLGIMILCTATNTGNIIGSIDLIQG